ncbi:MAG: hypothetical protein ABSB91_00650 [Sedimentisphaerales bacterium]
MTNRVDFYQAEQEKTAMPAGGAVVFIEGRLCENLEVVEISKGGFGKYGSARMACQMNDLNDDEVEIGKEVSIRWLYNPLYPAGGAEGLVMFAGQIEKVEKTIGPDGVSVEVIARDFSEALERITVFGRHIRDIDGREVFIESQASVFNEDGEPNACDTLIEDGGNEVRLFAADSKGARYWNCADVIRYLLCEYLPVGQLTVPAQERLEVLTGGATVRDLDVTGMSLLKAIEKCCGQAGVGFKFVPRLDESGPKQAIIFYKGDCGGGVELNLQQAGERLSISKTNIWKANSESGTPVTSRYIGLGDNKVYEATFDLVKGWSRYDEDDDYEKFSPSTNSDFYKVKDVWRKWCLNEAGDYAGEPFNQGTAFDFIPVFETGKYIHKRRRFWPAISCDAQGRSMGYFLEVSYDSGGAWQQYMGAFENLLDECGIWLASDRLDQTLWNALLAGALRVRFTASVVSDERLSCVTADGPVGGTIPVVERIVDAGSSFKFRKVIGKSIFAGNNAIGKADQRDDSAELNQFIRQKAEANRQAIETFDIATPFLAIGFEVGDKVISNPDARSIFSTTGDNRSTAIIESVRMDFRKQTTEMKIVKSKM